MRIDRVLWNARSVADIARHQITPEDVEDVLFSSPLQARRAEREDAYLVLGRCRSGRRLLVVIALRPRTGCHVVTARDVDRAEQRRRTR